jgi:hypothetical protein
VDASFFEIPMVAGDAGREEKVVQLFNLLREADRLSGQRRRLMALLGLFGIGLVFALFGELGRSALPVVAAMSGTVLIGVVRLRHLEHRNRRRVESLASAVGARGF